MTYDQLKQHIDILERRLSYLEKIVIPTIPIDQAYSPDDVVKIIINITSAVLKVDKAMIVGKSSIPTVCDARRISYALCKDFTSLSLAEIGRKIGERNHSTIIDGLRKHNDYCQSDPKYLRYYNKSYQMVNQALTSEQPTEIS